MENREETALVFRDFAATTRKHAETIPPASQAAYMFSLYFITLFYLSAVKECSFLPINVFKKIDLLLSKTLLTMHPSVFIKDKKTFFVSELITRSTVTDQS